MQRRLRLTGSKRFSEIHREGASAANRLLVVRFLANDLDRTRFGFVVSKRNGNAVARNRIKRRLREAVRQHCIRPGWDAVFIARRGIDKASFQQITQAAENLLRRSQLVVSNSRGPVQGQQRSRLTGPSE